MDYAVFQHEAMATHFEIVVSGQDPEYARQAARAAFRETDHLEGLLSRYIESSDISRINHLRQGESTTISDETLDCLLIAADLCLATRGTFDPAYASVRAPDPGPDAPPFTLDPANHRLTSCAERLRLDLGAVGKGFALDRMADILREWGIASALLNAGDSSALALTAPPADEPSGWCVGLGEDDARREFPLLAASLSGSGTAVKGQHLIDPRTGQPAPRRLRVWALAPTAAQADALSTAFFVMTEPDIAALCEAHPRIGAAVTLPDGRLTAFGALRENDGV
jgi:thiamine biosynthesis lipoprotein